MTNEERLVAVAQAEDTYDLLQHIAWTDILLPQLEKEKKAALEAIAAFHLGTPLPNGVTVEKLAGKAYGINYVTQKIENVLTRGKKALGEIQEQGIHIT